MTGRVRVSQRSACRFLGGAGTDAESVPQGRYWYTGAAGWLGLQAVGRPELERRLSQSAWRRTTGKTYSVQLKVAQDIAEREALEQVDGLGRYRLRL